MQRAPPHWQLTADERENGQFAIEAKDVAFDEELVGFFPASQLLRSPPGSKLGVGAEVVLGLDADCHPAIRSGGRRRWKYVSGCVIPPRRGRHLLAAAREKGAHEPARGHDSVTISLALKALEISFRVDMVEPANRMARPRQLGL